jgi:hypothetical protein
MIRGELHEAVDMLHALKGQSRTTCPAWFADEAYALGIERNTGRVSFLSFAGGPYEAELTATIHGREVHVTATGASVDEAARNLLRALA